MSADAPRGSVGGWQETDGDISPREGIALEDQHISSGSSPSARPFDACLFDLDGVLADSMPQHHRGYRQVLEPLGFVVERQDVFAREGMNAWGLISDIAQKQGRPLGEEEARRLGREKQAAFRAMGRVPLMEGAEAAVKSLRAEGLRVAVATGTHRENAAFMLGPLADQFDCIIAEGDYSHPKPSPEPYLQAARRLGLPPARCCVIENACNGVQAAKRAGMVCIALTSTMPEAELASAGADVVVGSLDEACQAVLNHVPAGVSG